MIDLDFNRLPLPIRQRFLQLLRGGVAGPVLAFSTSSIRRWLLGGLLLLGLVALPAGAFAAFAGMPEIGGIVAGACFFAMTLLPADLLARRVPFRAGTYLFASGVLLAKDRSWRFIPLHHLQLSRIIVLRAGVPVRTHLVLRSAFEGGPSNPVEGASFQHPTKAALEQAEATIQFYRAELERAWATRDAALTARLDPFFDLGPAWQERDASAVGPRVSTWLAKPLLALQLVAALGLTVATAVGLDRPAHGAPRAGGEPVVTVAAAPREVAVPNAELRAMLNDSLASRGGAINFFSSGVDSTALLAAERDLPGANGLDVFGASPDVRSDRISEAFREGLHGATGASFAVSSWPHEEPGAPRFALRMVPSRVGTHRVARTTCALLEWTVTLEATQGSQTWSSTRTIPAFDDTAELDLQARYVTDYQKERICYEHQARHLSQALGGVIRAALEAP